MDEQPKAINANRSSQPRTKPGASAQPGQRNRRGKERDPRPKQEKSCYGCGGLGHFAAECPTTARRKAGAGAVKPKQGKKFGGKKPGARQAKKENLVAAAAVEDVQRLQGENDALREQLQEAAIPDPQEIERYNARFAELAAANPEVGEPPEDEAPPQEHIDPPGGEPPRQEEIPAYEAIEGWKIEYAEAPRMFYGTAKYLSFLPFFLLVALLFIHVAWVAEPLGLASLGLLTCCLLTAKGIPRRERFAFVHRALRKYGGFVSAVRTWSQLVGTRVCVVGPVAFYPLEALAGVSLIVGVWALAFLDWALLFFLAGFQPLVVVKLVSGPFWKFLFNLAAALVAWDPVSFAVGFGIILSLSAALFYVWLKSWDNFIKHRFVALGMREAREDDLRPDWMKNQDMKHGEPLYTVVKYEKVFRVFSYEFVIRSRELLVSGELFAQCASMRHLAILDDRTSSMARVEAGVRKIGTVNIDRYLAFGGNDVMQMTCLLIYAHGESLKEKASLLPFPSVGLH